MSLDKPKRTYQELLDLIEAEMNFCDSENTPFLCANLSAGPESKAKIIKLIADYVIKNRTISQAILDCERDFNPNIADNPYS